MNFATLQGLTIPQGVVTQIADASGRVLWKLETSKPVVLQVEKITSDTYAGETTYTGEQFILLDIYPKTNGTVKVTYGGLTKTIADTSGAEEPNAQQVFFGTFNGVSDSVTTPASGELTIEGDCYGVGVGKYSSSSKDSNNNIVCSCVTAITDLGNICLLPPGAFRECTKIEMIDIPEGVTEIGVQAFWRCSGLKTVNIPSSVNSLCIDRNMEGLMEQTFRECYALTSINVDADNELFSSENGVLYNKDKSFLIAYPYISGHCEIVSSVQQIGNSAFFGRTALTSVTIPSGVTYIYHSAFEDCSGLTNVTVLADTPPACGKYAFKGSTCPITVPKGRGDAYKAAEGWSTYADRIVEAS